MIKQWLGLFIKTRPQNVVISSTLYLSVIDVDNAKKISESVKLAMTLNRALIVSIKWQENIQLDTFDQKISYAFVLYQIGLDGYECMDQLQVVTRKQHTVHKKVF